MKFVKHLPLVVFLVLTGICHQAGAIQSYREWKVGQIVNAQTQISNIKTQLEMKKQERVMKREIAQGRDPNMMMGRAKTEAVSGPDVQSEKLERQLKQELYELDLARDLTVSDYFAGYLTKIQDKKTAFAEVAGKLSPEEVAELMNAYANSVFGSHATDIPASAINTTRDPVK